MQNNIRTLITDSEYAPNLKRDSFENNSYKGTVFHALKQFLSSDELNQIVNGYRRSPWTEDAFYRNFDKTDVPEHAVLKDEHYYKALSQMDKHFAPKNKLLPVHYADLRLYPWRLSTNIGAPYNVQPSWIDHVKSKYRLGLTTDIKLTKHNLYNEFFVNNRYLYHLIKDGKTTSGHGIDLKYWNTAFARLHLVKQDEPDKVRLVFGAPTLLLQTEMAFIWPIQISLLNRGTLSPMLWGFETIKGGWHKLYSWFSTNHPRLRTFFTFDWSSFDLLARHTVIDDIHNVWRSWFTFDDGYWPTRLYPQSTPEPTRLENLWKWMTNAIKATPLLLPDGRLVRFLHSGIFSGYLQTQLLDSCYNMTVILTILSRMGFNIEKVVLKVQGDDSIGGLLESIPECYWPSFLEQFAYYGKLYFGSKLNLKKSELLSNLENAEVLKYRNHGGIPYRPELDLLAALYHPERNQTLPILMARAIGIAYANCGAHHRVYAICEDIYLHLQSQGYSPDPKGLPGSVLFELDDHLSPKPADTTGFSPLDNSADATLPYDITRFPSFFDTMKMMTNIESSQVNNHHWLSSHFIGTPL